MVISYCCNYIYTIEFEKCVNARIKADVQNKRKRHRHLENANNAILRQKIFQKKIKQL